MSKEKVALYDAMIEELDAKFAEGQTSQAVATGDQKTIFESVANRMAERNEYRLQRLQLVRARDEAEGPSPDVAEYIAGPKKVASKFDVDAGTDKIDDSLQPLGGKKV